MDHSKKTQDSPKWDLRLFNITPNPIEKALNQPSILKTPGKTPINKIPLLTPNFTINESS